MKSDKDQSLRLSIKTLSSSLESTGSSSTPSQPPTPLSVAKDENKEVKPSSKLKMASMDLKNALDQWSALSDGNKRLSPNEKALEDMKVLLKELKEKLAQFE